MSGDSWSLAALPNTCMVGGDDGLKQTLIPESVRAVTGDASAIMQSPCALIFMSWRLVHVPVQGLRSRTL